MATQRLSMRQTREILRQRLLLHRSYREIGRSLGVSVGAAANAVARAQAQGLEWPAVQVLTDAALEAYLYRRAELPRGDRPIPDCEYLHTELHKVGVSEKSGLHGEKRNSCTLNRRALYSGGSRLRTSTAPTS